MNLQLITAILLTIVAIAMLLRWQKLRTGEQPVDARNRPGGALLAAMLFAFAAAINWLIYLRVI